MTTNPTTAWAGGRLNIIGDHTDYTGGLALPMAIELGTTIEVRRGGNAIHLTSDQADSAAVIPIDIEDPTAVKSGWARYVAGVVAELRPEVGAIGTVTSDLPIGAGMSSSASLEIAVALALGFRGEPHELAELCRRAEHRASGVPCGILDQLAIASGTAGALTRLDCESLEASPVPFPSDVVIMAVHSGQSRTLAGSAYADRHAECATAERALGSLRQASLADVERLGDPVVRRRARHVVTENGRVGEFVGAIERGEYGRAGLVLNASHASLRDDFEVSTPTVDAVVDSLVALPQVYGARMTGGGFGGIVIALCDPAVQPPAGLPSWRLRPVDGTRVGASRAWDPS